MIQRTIEKRVLEDLTFFPVVSIIGPRQVGKTTLVKSIAQGIGKETEYLDLELFQMEKLMSAQKMCKS